MAHQLAPEVRDALGAVGRVAGALVGSDAFEDVAAQALAEMRDALQLEAAALYLPKPGPHPALERFALCEAPDMDLHVRSQIVFDAESWQLTVRAGTPLILREPAAWLMDHPFDPPASAWMVLPLGTGEQMAGVVIAASAEPVALTPTAAAVLQLLCDLLNAGIHTAQLRQELQRTAVERERMRLAAEVHDGLAQDLALAMRELTLLEGDLPADAASDSRTRLREAVASAHSIVRGRLKELSGPAPLGGIQPSVRELCERFEHRGLAVRLRLGPGVPEPSPASATVVLRVLAEALTNIQKHAEASLVEVELGVSGTDLLLTVEDDGRGFDVGAVAGPGEGHLGLALMHARARAAGGTLGVSTTRQHGTRVALALPLTGDRG
jgi:signal transduction histidine kinase